MDVQVNGYDTMTRESAPTGPTSHPRYLSTVPGVASISLRCRSLWVNGQNVCLLRACHRPTPHSLDPGGLHWIVGDGTVILARSSAAGGLSGTHAGGVLSRTLGE